jgi:predicted component of type VI protein secretion system
VTAPTLTLEVTGAEADTLRPRHRKTFTPAGGTLGRSAGNAWVLPDAFVSGRHASIGFRDDRFWIDDLSSTNGVQVNDRYVEPGQPCELRGGDRLFIKPYAIAVSVAEEPAALSPVPVVSVPFIEAEEVRPSSDWLDDLAPAVSSAAAPVSSPPPVLGNDPVKAHYAPGVALIPEDYDPMPRPAPVPPAAVEPPSRGAPDLAAVLAGAGLEGVTVTPEVARQFGQILRVVVDGVLEILRARQEVKGEFRIRPTVIRRRRNNPLKHSVDADDALHNLLVKQGPGYLGPVEAFEDAFKDLRNHQLAMLAGVRVAFDAMFRQFDPERLQREFDRHTPRARKGPFTALQARPDYWDLYRDWVQRLSQDADGTFRTLFGQDFANAYEEQLERLGGKPR